MSDPIDKTGCVVLYAARIHYYANELVKTHRLEGQTGFDDRPWEMPYQRLAAKIYPENLPHSYLATLANVFAGCARTMNAQPAPPDQLAEDWRIVHAYLTNGSQAIAEMLEIDVVPEWEDPTDKDPTTPSNVRFDILATYVSRSGATKLAAAGQAVSGCLPVRPVTASQLALLKEIAEGRRIPDIAADRFTSRRSLQREIEQLWHMLGVENREQGIALAARRGWI